MLTGLYIDKDGKAHLREIAPDGGFAERLDTSFKPFLWAAQWPLEGSSEPETLGGTGELNKLVHFCDFDAFRKAAMDRETGAEVIKPLEAQYLIQKRLRYFEGMTFNALRRVSLDVDIAESPEGETPAVVAMILPDGSEAVLSRVDSSPEAEKALLAEFAARLNAADPDVVEGHDAYAALDVILARMKKLRIKAVLGRFGVDAASRKSRMRIAERWIDYPRVDIPGRSVFDTSLATQVYDVSTRELPGYSLEEVAEYFEVPGADEDCPHDLPPAATALRRAKLARAVADILLPTYFSQAQNIPMPLQEVCLRGSSGKVDSLLFERYYHARHALPAYPPPAPFEGAFSRSFETGVFHNVSHYDVASLYPSLLLAMNRAPQGDELGIFIPLLRELRELRLSYKKMAREAATAELRALYGARQQSFKILINSFYGYLGFPQARFADPALAAEVTRRGRELIQNLIARFQSFGCKVLEADTDGIYLVNDAFRADPEALLAKVADLLPEGVSLEYDGHYESMFCYKAKNYALLEEGHVHLRGSSFRSRGTEPYLRKLTTHLVRWLLGAEQRPAKEIADEYRARIASGKMDLAELARSEDLSMNPAAYKRKIDEGGKPRRASLEVALRMTPAPAMGSRVSYYILPKEKGRASDWQRARPLAEYDSAASPYAADYYLDKLDEWEKRYAAFLNPGGPVQNELPM